MDQELELQIKEPTLDPYEKLYVKAFLSTLSHIEAHRLTEPALKKHKTDNKYASRPNIEYHIQKGLFEKTEALGLTPDTIIQKLYREATYEGQGANHAARITALVHLGKHLGMFQEKKEKEVGHTFNIISYDANSSKVATDIIEKIEEKPKEETTFSIPLEITTYGE